MQGETSLGHDYFIFGNFFLVTNILVQIEVYKVKRV